jgi:hypothetical protein
VRLCCLPACPPALPAGLPTCLPAHLPACLRTCLPTCPPVLWLPIETTAQLPLWHSRRSSESFVDRLPLRHSHSRAIPRMRARAHVRPVGVLRRCAPGSLPTDNSFPDGFEYRWADGVGIKTPIKCTSTDYIDYVMT